MKARVCNTVTGGNFVMREILRFRIKLAVLVPPTNWSVPKRPRQKSLELWHSIALSGDASSVQERQVVGPPAG